MAIQPATAAILSGLTLAASAQPLVSGRDPSGIMAGYAGQTAFDRTPGNLEISDFRLHALLSNPLPPLDGWVILPVFDFGTTILRFNDVPTSLPVDTGNLQSFNVYVSQLSLSTFALFSDQSTPWVFGGWGRVQLASDFQEVEADDLTYDVAGGIGYRFSEQLTLGVGAMVTDLNGNHRIQPAIGMEWSIGRDLHITVRGPEWRIVHSTSDTCRLSLRGEQAGEIWNIQDDRRKSRSIDLRSYRIGFFIQHQLKDQLEFQTGIGVTLMNEISLTSPRGRNLLRQGTDQGMFCEIGVKLASW